MGWLGQLALKANGGELLSCFSGSLGALSREAEERARTGRFLSTHSLFVKSSLCDGSTRSIRRCCQRPKENENRGDRIAGARTKHGEDKKGLVVLYGTVAQLIYEYIFSAITAAGEFRASRLRAPAVSRLSQLLVLFLLLLALQKALVSCPNS